MPASLNRLLNVARASTPSGSSRRAPTQSDADVSGPRNTIARTPTTMLKTMCASAARRTARLPPTTTSPVVAAVPTLCPTTIAQAWTNVIEPVLSATSVVAPAAVELCMTIDMATPTPARIQLAPAPVPANLSRFQEIPAIPSWRKSIPVKISPKPARIAPNERVRPRVISQSNAPMPSIGIAADEILNRRPKSATSQIVEVVPSVAPTIIPVASANVTRPALTKPMTVRMAAVEDWITAVKSAPDATALNRPATRRWRARRSESPASPLMPSVRWWMPSRKRPSPPRSVTQVPVTASLLGLELLARRRELLLLGGVDGRIGEVEVLDRLHDRGRDH